MTSGELDRMAEGIIRLRAAIIRERNRAGEETIPLTSPQALALRAIVLRGRLRVGALAEELGVSVPTASRTAEALVERGLVERTSDPVDARAKLLAPTARGTGEHAARRARFTRALEDVLAGLPPDERTQLAASLETLERVLAGQRDAALVGPATG